MAAVVLHANDDVAVLIRPVTAGERIAVGGARGTLSLRVAADLPLGHKVALRPLASGADVRKYGEVIGRLTAEVDVGGHVHIQNLTSLRAH